MKRELDTTLGSTLPGAAPGEQPKLDTFDRPGERFELGSELGRGGMGRVVAATDVALARSVAIKQVLSDRPDDLVRFEREVRITAQLEHPSIVPIHEAARDASGRPYYVMRRIEGEALSKRIEGADLPTRLAMLPNMLAVVDAAAFAHARNIIHRDIKPSNILLGAYGETHLIDWGLARRLDDLDVSSPGAIARGEQLTQAGHVYGTVGYMAPEQARGEPVDQRADVYALGATLFHVLAGVAPFAHMSDVERISAAATGEDRAPVDKLGEGIPPELIAIVDKAMATDRDARYENAGELATDLRAFLGGKLVAAHRYTAGQRLRRFVRKHRVAVLLSTVSLAIAIVVVIIAIRRTFNEKLRAVEARAVAEQRREEAASQADLQRIETASTLAASQPTRAAAMLLQLPRNTKHAALARDTIAKVAASGIARGASIHTRPVNSMAFSPDGKTLASVGEDGRLVLYDVATGRATRVTENRGPLYTVEWSGPRVVLVTGLKVGVLRIDLETKAERVLHDGRVSRIWQVGSKVRFHDHVTREVKESGLDGEAVVLARDAQWAAGADQLVIYGSSKTGLFLRNGDVTTKVDLPPDPLLLQLAFSPDRSRVAVATSTETIEVDVATAKPVQRWPVSAPMILMYRSRGLIASGHEPAINFLRPDGRVDKYPSRTSPMWATQIASGLVLAYDSGMFVVVDRAGTHQLDHAYNETRAVAGTPDGMTVAFGSRGGTVRWIDLEPVVPNPIHIPEMRLCTTTGTHFYAFDLDGVAEVRLADHRVRRIETGADLMSAISCHAEPSKFLLAFLNNGLSRVDLATGEEKRFPGVWPIVDGGRIFYTNGSKVMEMRDDGSSHELYAAPVAIESLAKVGDWLALDLVGGQLMRVDLSTRAVASIPATPETFGIRRDGSLWFTMDRYLIEWQPPNLVVRASFGEPIVKIAPVDDGGYFVQLTDASIWDLRGRQPLQRISTGVRKLSFSTDALALGATNIDFAKYFLATGVEVIHPYEGVKTSRVLPDGRSVLAAAANVAMLFRDPVPVSFDDAMSWLATATNARFAPSTGALQWEQPGP